MAVVIGDMIVEVTEPAPSGSPPAEGGAEAAKTQEDRFAEAERERREADRRARLRAH